MLWRFRIHPAKAASEKVAVEPKRLGMGALVRATKATFVTVEVICYDRDYTLCAQLVKNRDYTHDRFRPTLLHVLSRAEPMAGFASKLACCGEAGIAHDL